VAEEVEAVVGVVAGAVVVVSVWSILNDM